MEMDTENVPPSDEARRRITLPTADDIRDVTARALVRARLAVRTDSLAAMKHLKAASTKEWRERVGITVWTEGVKSTFAGAQSQVGKGARWILDIADYSKRLKTYAQSVHPKNLGVCITHAVTKWAGSGDDEVEEISMLFADCDGLGNVDSIIEAMEICDLGFVLQERPGTRKHHLMIPWAKPIVPPSEGRGQWKHNWYMPRLGWVLGILSEFARLDFQLAWSPGEGGEHVALKTLGYDHATTRLAQLGNPYCRRTEEEPAPRTIASAGKALDLDRLLSLTGFSAGGVPAPRRRPARARTARASAPCIHQKTTPGVLRALKTDGILVAALEKAGWLGRRLGPDKYAALCPWRESHSTMTDGGSSTAVWTDGGFKCLHSGCSDRTAIDVYDVLPYAARRVIDKARLRPPREFIEGTGE